MDPLFVGKINKFAKYCWQLKLVSGFGINVTLFDTVLSNSDPQEFLKKFQSFVRYITNLPSIEGRIND